MNTTMFKLVTDDNSTINIIKFADFNDDPAIGRTKAEAHAKYLKSRWEAQWMFADKSLKIIEV